MNKKKNAFSQEEVWDKVSGKWNEFRNEPKQGVPEFLKKQKGKVLDLGCGTGRHFIKSKKIQIYGIDFSEKMLKFAREKDIAIEIKKAEAIKIPYDDNFFNTAIFIATLQCIETKEKREKSLKEIYRVLKSGSEALITVLSKGHIRVRNKTKETTIPWTVNGIKYHRYYYVYDLEELESLLKKIGFKIIKIEQLKRSKNKENIVAIVKKP